MQDLPLAASALKPRPATANPLQSDLILTPEEAKPLLGTYVLFIRRVGQRVKCHKDHIGGAASVFTLVSLAVDEEEGVRWLGKGNEGGDGRVRGSSSSEAEFEMKSGPRECSGLTIHLPTRRTGFDSQRGRSWIFACGNRTRRCHSSAGILGDIPFPPPLHSDAGSYSPHFTVIGSQKPDEYFAGRECHVCKKRWPIEQLWVTCWCGYYLAHESCLYKRLQAETMETCSLCGFQYTLQQDISWWPFWQWLVCHANRVQVRRPASFSLLPTSFLLPYLFFYRLTHGQFRPDDGSG
ncbi:hypothetical protein PR048_005945 [Dryococelus australis]|uniref:Uncharacterized protein n=1 Tax=Dryococelus australis TaxID=614101 RepID=A0ABQ9I9L9_9NEOP|nr:hypothetical protein PR048_005945 [Dryococelus australis]